MVLEKKETIQDQIVDALNMASLNQISWCVRIFVTNINHPPFSSKRGNERKEYTQNQSIKFHFAYDRVIKISENGTKMWLICVTQIAFLAKHQNQN